jgi:hypothetical protein
MRRVHQGRAGRARAVLAQAVLTRSLNRLIKKAIHELTLNNPKAVFMPFRVFRGSD